MVTPGGRLIGLYGGTFDPVHLAHLRVAEAAHRELGLQAVTFIPARVPALRAAPLATAQDRLAMLQLAIAGRAYFSVDAQELQRVGPSYTIDTLLALRAAYGPVQPLAWLVGADAFTRLSQWQRWRELNDLAHFIVVARPGHALAPHDGAAETYVRSRHVASSVVLHEVPAGAIYQFAGPGVDISATQIRARCAGGESLEGLLSEEVWAYIRQHRLYGWH